MVSGHGCGSYITIEVTVAETGERDTETIYQSPTEGGACRSARDAIKLIGTDTVQLHFGERD